MMRYDSVKRALDLVGSSVGLIITVPLQAAVALAVWRFHGRPVLFRQIRPGKDGQPFTLLKFRTMLQLDGIRISDADRLTPFGKALRATSLDELPSLWNVFRGDMSFVGPRPLLMKYLTLYTPEQMRRHDVRPGITGLAQVRGRNATSWKARLAHDLDYVERRSFRMDAMILLATFLVVARRDGISSEGEVTMREFRGIKGSDS